MTGRPVRCLLGMLGVDVHSRGLRTIALLLRDAGVEVVYVGEHNSPAGMVAAGPSTRRWSCRGTGAEHRFR